MGRSGDDLLVGDSGADILSGQEGNDTAAYHTSDAGVSVNLVAGTGQDGDAEGDLLGSIENVIGSLFDDVIFADGAANNLYGLAGNDRLWGGDGDDFLNGGAGADTQTGGAGHDTTSYANSAAGVRVVLFQHIGTAGDAQGDLLGSIEDIVGSQSNDQIFGDNAANALFGLGGHDSLEGDAGSDTLDGGDGFDKLFGQDGDDTLTGGAGQDRLLGGAGADTFVFRALTDSVVGVADEIVEFTSAHGDRIDLAAIDADAATAGDQQFIFVRSAAFSGAAGELRYDGRLLSGDVNGDAVADFEIQFNVSTLQSSDFVL